MGVYQDRDRLLRTLGYSSYASYQRSPLWNLIRYNVIERDGRRCRCCGKKATCVHHDSYSPEVIDGRNLDPLYSLCGRCHDFVEFDGKDKRSFIASQLTLRRLLAGEVAPKQRAKNQQAKKPAAKKNKKPRAPRKLKPLAKHRHVPSDLRPAILPSFSIKGVP